MDLIEFLHARYDEAEELARNAAAERHPSGFPTGTAVEYGLERIGLSEAFRLFATMWEPRDVLADLAAKQQILGLIDPMRNLERSWEHKHGGDWHTGGSDLLLRLLAAPYAEHPDYDPAWRIDA